MNEMEARKTYLDNQSIDTVYFGGGTPSMLSHQDLFTIEQKIRENFQISDNAEITLEANPDDISDTYLDGLKDTFVNRLSMGVQSFFADDLEYLNRVHSASQAIDAIKMAQDAGFDRITIDLIYGIPTLTDEKWIKNIHTFLEAGITHLSAYALTVESKTALAHLIHKGQLAPVDEVQSARHFEILLKLMEENGFNHYEISNFAKPGHYSRHNSIYWLGGHYLGLGPSAHSFNGYSREWNVSNLGEYINNSGSTTCVEEKEILTIVQRFNEYVMTSLRTSWGCDLEHIKNGFGPSYSSYLISAMQKHIKNEHLIQNGTQLYLTNKGKLFADGIASDLFIEESL
jgi:oxygen-independent coproporphyrinogen-3 oxidase